MRREVLHIIDRYVPSSTVEQHACSIMKYLDYCAQHSDDVITMVSALSLLNKLSDEWHAQHKKKICHWLSHVSQDVQRRRAEVPEAYQVAVNVGVYLHS